MRLSISLLLATLFLSCGDREKKPDVSTIKIDMTTRRFEKELFSLDTNRFSFRLDQLIAKYPSFGENFLTTILSTDPKWNPDTTAAYVGGFIESYRPVYDTAEKVFADFSPYENEIKNSLQLLKYYYPQYKAPNQIITYIGPMDGYGDILSEDAFLVGLHNHLGKNYSAYQSRFVQETYPPYITNRFEPAFISVNCMKNIVTDIYPEKEEDKSLLVQMVEKGKRLYMLSKLLPSKPEYMLIGYTEKQLKECYEREAQIWDLFVQNNLLQSTDNNIIKNYVSEGPKTQELGEGSPGNIGSFVGLQIVKKYMQINNTTSLPQLMEMNSEIIYSKAKYKP